MKNYDRACIQIDAQAERIGELMKQIEQERTLKEQALSTCNFYKEKFEELEAENKKLKALKKQTEKQLGIFDLERWLEDMGKEE